MQEEVTAILDGWTEVRAQDFGAFWLVVGVDPYGVPRGGSRADALSLAADLRDIAEREKPQAPEPVSPVQPTDPVQVSASPSEVQETPSDGGAAPQEEPPPASVSSYPGMMMQEDEIGLRKTALKGQITDYATALIRARVPSDAAFDDRLQYLRHLVLMGAITEELTAELNWLEKVPGWIVRVQEYSALLQQRVDDKQSLAELSAFDPFHGWPQ